MTVEQRATMDLNPLEWKWPDDGLVRLHLEKQWRGDYLMQVYVGRRSVRTADGFVWPTALAPGDSMTFILGDPKELTS